MRAVVRAKTDAAHSGHVLTIGIIKDVFDTVSDVGVVEILAATNENQTGLGSHTAIHRGADGNLATSSS